VSKPLRSVSVEDLQAFAESLTGARSSRRRTLSAIKSLLSFGQDTGYLQFNVGAAVKCPSVKDSLAERILSEEDVHRVIVTEAAPRNRALLRLLYAAGLRVSEACSLKWRDLQPRDEAGQVTVFGKGDKTRTILLSEATWAELAALRGDAGPDDAVFRSRKKGGHLTPSAVFHVVRAAARRAGIEGNVSPHWLRHAHASHALDRGAPIHLVQQTLGHASVATTGRYLHARPSDSSARYLAV
jgi:integrase/recombinase XerD